MTDTIAHGRLGEINRHKGNDHGTAPVHQFFFFFSSRRRHTRWTGDWSSDVCSPDLGHFRTHSPGLEQCSSDSTRVAISRSAPTDRKSTRLNSSHPSISYAVFCLK